MTVSGTAAEHYSSGAVVPVGLEGKVKPCKVDYGTSRTVRSNAVLDRPIQGQLPHR